MTPSTSCTLELVLHWLRHSWLAGVVLCAYACGAKSGLGEVALDAGADATLGGSGGVGGVGGVGGTTTDACAQIDEVCNGLDDDCDGVADDGVACFFLGDVRIEPVPSTGCGASWYSYDFPDTASANPVPDIRRSGKVVLAVQYTPSCGSAHVAVIADMAMDGSGGQLVGELEVTPPGNAGIVVSDEPNECTGATGSGAFACDWVWQPCCTDGVLLGPLTSNACVTVRLDKAVGVSEFLVLDGASGEIPVAFPANVELCMTLTPAA